jgi:spermidine/putrescine transport system ATP-binding protein
MLKLINISKENGKRVILNKISLEINEGEFVCFVGPSGSGKTALLRIIAGLEAFDSGEIILKGENISKKAPFERNINTIFNSFSLFPELNVYDNIKFGLNFKKISNKEKDRIVNSAVDLFELNMYTKLNMNEIDKNIKYKIVLARALVNNPDILLLDDALMLLYNKDRLKMRYKLKLLQQELDKTFIYITSDINTAFALGDKIGILQNGVLHQFDTPKNIYEIPNTFFVAGFVGNMNFFYAKIKGEKDAYYIVEIDDKFDILVPKLRNFDSHREIFFAVRNERIEISKSNEYKENINTLEGKIIHKSYNAEYTQYYIQLDYGKVIIASALNYSIITNNYSPLQYEIGEKVYLHWSILNGVLVYA